MKPGESEKSNVIDLTQDDDDGSENEPPPSKINSNGLYNRSIVDYNQPSTSRGLGAQSWNLSSNQDTKIERNGETRNEFCIICKESKNLTPKPPCSHLSCYNCFRSNILKLIKEPKCVLKTCYQKFDQIFVKSVLNLEDYVEFLETECTNLRTALKSKTEHDKRKEEKFDLETLEKFNDQSFNTNFFEFMCPICLERIEAHQGVILKNCSHFFCKVCISDTIRHSEDQLVFCPHRNEDGKACELILQDREIRSLVSEKIYENHLKKGLKQAEITMDDVFHCRTPDCDGFSIPSKDTKAFPCPICHKVNCVLCNAIHETKTCEQYKEDLELNTQNVKDLAKTEKQVAKMLEKGKAILCINCKSVIQKTDGCNSVICAICRTNMCWMTGKPRRDFEKMVDGIWTIIEGCRCGENGKFCHPKCNGQCH